MTTKNFLLSLFFIFLTIAGFYLYTVNLRSQKDTPLTVDTSIGNIKGESVVIYNLPGGEQIYNVSHGEDVAGPKMSQIIYTPLSFKQGETQKIKIIFSEKEVVGSVVVFITTDSKENQKVSFTKDSKTNTWVGEWTPEDSIKTRYSVKIVAVGAAGEYNNTMYFL